MRVLDTTTLDRMARHLEHQWGADDVMTASGKRWKAGPQYVLQQIALATFADEQDYLIEAVKARMGAAKLVEFEKAMQDVQLRSEKAHVEALRTKLAIDPKGNHIEGVRGTTVLDSRYVGTDYKRITTRSGDKITVPKSLYWPIYAGEEQERKLGSNTVDILPPDADPAGVSILNANNPTISAEAAQAMADALAARFDEGSTAALITVRSGAQPVDPDAAPSGTLLATLTMSDPAFGAATDGAPGAVLTANAITDDSSADATGTAGYCRISAAGTGADDHMDGEAGTSGSDINFNTTSLVAGAVVGIDSATITLGQGATAT